jgi:peptidyl-prolyl cis-trans isomerase D
VLEHRKPELQSFDDVQGEIEFRIQLDKIRERSVALGESVLSSMQEGLNIDTLLETQNLSWNQVDGLKRADQILPPELVQNIFELAPPEGDQSRVEGFELSTGEYVVVDLQSVNSGSVEDLEDAELESLKTFIAQQSTNSDFGALILGMQNRSEIIR